MTPDTPAMPEFIYLDEETANLDGMKVKGFGETKYIRVDLSTQPDVEALKRSTLPSSEYAFNNGWNAAIDHLAATGRLNGVAPEKVEGLDEALSCKGDGSFTEKYGRTPFDVIKEAARRYAALDKIVEDAGKGL